MSAETLNSQPLDQVVPEPIALRRADALERVAEGFLAGAKNENSGGDRYMVNIHTEMDTLRDDGTGAESEIEDRGHVSADMLIRLSSVDTRCCVFK